MKLFELRASGPTDCTTPYDVVFHKECTVQEFIEEVLKKNEWGSIIIGSHYDYNNPRIEYKHDKIVSGAFCLDIMDARITKAIARSGWTNMDYMLDIRSDEKRFLRHEYAETLKEIVRHESEIAKLQKKVHDIEDKLESIEADKTEKPHLDKDGCVYWDSVLK